MIRMVSTNGFYCKYLDMRPHGFCLISEIDIQYVRIGIAGPIGPVCFRQRALIWNGFYAQ